MSLNNLFFVINSNNLVSTLVETLISIYNGILFEFALFFTAFSERSSNSWKFRKKKTNDFRIFHKKTSNFLNCPEFICFFFSEFLRITLSCLWKCGPNLGQIQINFRKNSEIFSRQDMQWILCDKYSTMKLMRQPKEKKIEKFLILSTYIFFSDEW